MFDIKGKLLRKSFAVLWPPELAGDGRKFVGLLEELLGRDRLKGCQGRGRWQRHCGQGVRRVDIIGGGVG